jgi:DNA-binding MarR family transcriptional regulator
MTELLRTFHDLVRVETLLWNAIDATLRTQCDLTLARFETMQVISRAGECRVLDIAGELAIGWSGASKIVDRVAAAGHCRRRANPDDARSSLITLTARGRALLTTAEICVAAELQRRVAPALTRVELSGLHRSLGRLRATLVTEQDGGNRADQ